VLGISWSTLKKTGEGRRFGKAEPFVQGFASKTRAAKRMIQARLVKWEVEGLWKDAVTLDDTPFKYNPAMANLTLVYGMRLLPADELAGVEDATIKLKNGKTARVTMHVLEGSKEDIEKQLRASTEAFFDFYPEI